MRSTGFALGARGGGCMVGVLELFQETRRSLTVANGFGGRNFLVVVLVAACAIGRGRRREEAEEEEEEEEENEEEEGGGVGKREGGVKEEASPQAFVPVAVACANADPFSGP